MTQQLERTERTSARTTMTYEDFLGWADEETRAEWVDGEVIVFMPPERRHAELVGFLFQLIGYVLTLRQVGTAYVAPFEMLVRDGQSSREPDVAVLLAEHIDRFS